MVVWVLRIRDQSDVQVKMEELEITNRRLLEDNTKLKSHVCSKACFILLRLQFWTFVCGKTYKLVPPLPISMLVSSFCGCLKVNNIEMCKGGTRFLQIIYVILIT